MNAPLRILVADDNRDTVHTLAVLLRAEGHEVRAAYNGMDVMRIARLHRFDALILDIEMPEMSGYAIAQELRVLHYGTRGPLLVAISGKWNNRSEKLLAQAVGFDHHFEKPCDPNVLLQLLAARGRGQDASGRNSSRGEVDHLGL
ncbi:MAG TPA: response regulator [Burkholderiales bacterium]|nr:response regulator [Burkholderiales bacterium]